MLSAPLSGTAPGSLYGACFGCNCPEITFQFPLTVWRNVCAKSKPMERSATLKAKDIPAAERRWIAAVLHVDVGDVVDGYQFRQAQRQNAVLASIPVIVLSCMGEVAAKAYCLGDVAYVQKPVDVDVLLVTIQRFTGLQRPVILVVEDEPAVLKMLDLALRHYGFSVKLAACGREAVELYRDHYRDIALVLLDVQMPDMDGPATLVALKEINPGLPCCFMSGHTGKYSTRELLDLGAAHVLMKPFVNLSLFTQLLWDTARPPSSDWPRRGEGEKTPPLSRKGAS